MICSKTETGVNTLKVGGKVIVGECSGEGGVRVRILESE